MNRGWWRTQNVDQWWSSWPGLYRTWEKVTVSLLSFSRRYLYAISIIVCICFYFLDCKINADRTSLESFLVLVISSVSDSRIFTTNQLTTKQLYRRKVLKTAWWHIAGSLRQAKKLLVARSPTSFPYMWSVPYKGQQPWSLAASWPPPPPPPFPI